MTDQLKATAEETLYNDLRDEPCILCGDPYMYVMGSYTPEEPKKSKGRQDKAPVLYYTLCEKCFNQGRIPTALIESAYKRRFGKMAA